MSSIDKKYPSDFRKKLSTKIHKILKKIKKSFISSYQMTHNLYLKGKLEYEENIIENRDHHIVRGLLVVACCCLCVDLNR